MTDHDQAKIKSYAILAGGGVKGAALVGGLHAAESHGIEFEGYGGASAGSLVALLASLGYRGRHLEQLIKETDFSSLFDDETGQDLNRLQNIGLKRYLFPFNAVGDSMLLNRIRLQFGLYKGHRFREYLLPKIIDKYPSLSNLKEIYFHHLKEAGAKALKIIVTDISHRKGVVYSAEPDDDETEGRVLEAVRASIGYPFVFEPLESDDPEKQRRYLVDGGLCSNLPVFLFAKEHKITRYPVLAFDLILPEKSKDNGRKYKIRDYCTDLIATALEASDDLHRQTITDLTRSVIYIPIKVPPGIDTFKFSLSPQERDSLYNAGYRHASEVLGRELRNLRSAQRNLEAVQATLNVPTYLIQPLLKAMAREVEEKTFAKSVRAHVMLPKGRDSLIVTYQYGMGDEDPDKDFQVDTRSKWMRKVYYDREPTLSNLSKLREQPSLWGLTKDEIRRIRPDRQTLVSVPIWEARASAGEVTELDCLGVLSIDTSSPLQYTPAESALDTLARWEAVIDIQKKWADIVARVLE
jgi:NTE family protein